MKGLATLPYEVLANIVSNVDFDDVVSLGRSCKFFTYLHTEESICKQIVQVSGSTRSSHVFSNTVGYLFQLLIRDTDQNSFLQ